MGGNGFLLTSLLDILVGSSRCRQTRGSGAQGEVWAKTPIMWLQDHLRVVRALGMESSQASSQSPRVCSGHFPSHHSAACCGCSSTTWTATSAGQSWRPDGHECQQILLAPKAGSAHGQAGHRLCQAGAWDPGESLPASPSAQAGEWGTYLCPKHLGWQGLIVSRPGQPRWVSSCLSHQLCFLHGALQPDLPLPTLYITGPSAPSLSQPLHSSTPGQHPNRS